MVEAPGTRGRMPPSADYVPERSQTGVLLSRWSSVVTGPLFQRPSVLAVRGLGLGAGTGYAAGCGRCAALGVEYAKDCEIEEGLHSGETGAEDPGAGFEGGPDAEVDEIICGGGLSYLR